MQNTDYTFWILDCEGPLKPEVVQSIDGIGGDYPASSVLILGEEDVKMDNDKFNFWLAQHQATEGQGFTMRLDNCARLIGGFQIKNKGEGENIWWGTKDFRVSGSRDENGPWETLVEDQLVDTTGGKPASLLNFTFKDPVTIKYIKFELVSFWGTTGGGLQYFAAIPATSKQHQCIIKGFWAFESGLRIFIRAPKVPCFVSEYGHFCQKCPSLRAYKWHFGCPNENSETLL